MKCYIYSHCHVTFHLTDLRLRFLTCFIGTENHPPSFFHFSNKSLFCLECLSPFTVLHFSDLSKIPHIHKQTCSVLKNLLHYFLPWCDCSGGILNDFSVKVCMRLFFVNVHIRMSMCVCISVSVCSWKCCIYETILLGLSITR